MKTFVTLENMIKLTRLDERLELVDDPAVA